jgi:hypothetical protein
VKTADIEPRHWYAEKKAYGTPSAFLVLGTARYSKQLSADRQYHELWASPESPLQSAKGWRRTAITGFLAVEVWGDAGKAMRDWAIAGADPGKAPEVMAAAARLLDKVAAAVDVAKGRVNLTELASDETSVFTDRSRPQIQVTLVQPRDLLRDYAIHIQEMHDQDLAHAKAERERKAAEDERRALLQATMTKAAELGLNIDRLSGGAYDASGYRFKYATISMSVPAYRELVDEIARLRELVGKTLTADENGETPPDVSTS